MAAFDFDFMGGSMGMALYQYGTGTGSMRGAVNIMLDLVDRLY